MSKYKITINGSVYEVEVEKMSDDHQVKTLNKNTSSKNSTEVNNVFTSPIQGNVLKINTAVNESVKKGDLLLVIEAMKLENEIVSDRDGIIENIMVEVGKTVNSGEVIINFKG